MLLAVSSEGPQQKKAEMLIEFVGKTDVGRLRNLNEDNYSAFASQDGKAYVFVVADGMGGANAGEVASKILTDHFTKKMKKINFGKMTIDSVKKTLTEVIRGANEKIYKKATSKKALSGMGTTVVAGVLFGEKLIAANVGDSRAYISHKSRLEIVTEDHTFVHDLFRSGAISATEEKNHPSKHILTRAVGVHSDVEVDTYICDFPKDAVLLLCSDGLTNMIEEAPMQRLIRRHKNMEKLSDRLVAVANEKGGQDNITVIVARRQEEVTRE